MQQPAEGNSDFRVVLEGFSPQFVKEQGLNKNDEASGSDDDTNRPNE